MTRQGMRPTRPTRVAAEAAKFAGDGEKERRLTIRVAASTLRSINLRAVTEDKTIKRFVMEALAAQGVEVAPEDASDH